MNSGTVHVLLSQMKPFSSFKELTDILKEKITIGNVSNVVIYYRLDYSDALVKIDWIKE